MATHSHSGPDSIQPYAPAPVAVGDGIWTWDGEWYQTAFKRRLTCLALKKSDQFWIHNPFSMQARDFDQIESLAKTYLGPQASVTGILAPNTFHGEEADAMKKRWPSARVLAVPSLAAKLAKKMLVDGKLPEAWSAEVQVEMPALRIQGLRPSVVDECVFFHTASKTLVVTDLVFNMGSGSSAGERLFFRLNGIDNRLTLSRIFKWIAIKDRRAFRTSIEQILAWDFERIVMNHGQVVLSDGNARFRQGFVELGLL